MSMRVICRKIPFMKQCNIFMLAMIGIILYVGMWYRRNMIYFNETSFKHFTYPVNIDMINLTSDLALLGIRPINPHPFSYTSSLEQKCSHSRIFLLILVKSATENSMERDIIRQSWGNESNYFGQRDRTVKIVFMLGWSKNSSLVHTLQREIIHYKDIVQENFEDAYSNNTFKTIMSFNWAVKYCGQAKYILFVDDDYLVYVDNIILYLSNATSVFVGMRDNINKYPPVRDRRSKWYVSLTDYPFDSFPPYLSGGAYIMSMDLVKRFSMIFPYIKYLFADDVYLGIVAYKLGIKPDQDERFMTEQPLPSDNISGLLAAHYDVNHSQMIIDWSHPNSERLPNRGSHCHICQWLIYLIISIVVVKFAMNHSFSTSTH